MNPFGPLTHFDEAPSRRWEVGHIRSQWALLGEAAGTVGVGVRRAQVDPGAWLTPVHEHGREEEIFFVLGGSGVSLQRDRVAAIGAGDCIVYHPRRGAHSVRAGEQGIELLLFGPRLPDEAPRFPRIAKSLLGGRAVDSAPGGIDGVPFQFVLEAELGPPKLPEEPGERPGTIVNLADVEPATLARGSVRRTRRRISSAAGSKRTGLQHVEVEPGAESAPKHCHSVEEEVFVVLGGSGVVELGDDELPLRPGHVLARPAATGVAHVFRAGPEGLTYLAYGTREPADMCWYPRSQKIAFSGLGVVVRVEPVDYWDGEA